MSLFAVLLTVAANPWPTLEHALDSRPIAVLEVPDASRSLQDLERSSFRKWSPTLLGKDASVVRKAGLRLIGAWYGTLSPAGGPDVVVSTDVQRELDQVQDMMKRWWRSLGASEQPGSIAENGWRFFTLAGKAWNVMLAANEEHRRVGWAFEADRAKALGQSQSPSLADDEAFRSMVSFAPRADLRGLVHVPRAFGWLLKQPGGDVVARMISRLGLSGAQMTPFAAEFVSRREARVTGKSVFTGSPGGVLASLGPEVPIQWPVTVPKDAKTFVALSVRPEQALQAAAQWMAADNPLQFTLVQAQITALEKRVGKRLGPDILGSGPQTWVSYRDPRGGWVAELGVVDSNAAQALFEALREAYPSAGIEPWSLGATPGFRLRSGSVRATVAFLPGAVLMSEDEGAMRRRLKAKVTDEPPGLLVKGKAVAFGRGVDVLRAIASRLRLPANGSGLNDVSAFRITRDGNTYGFYGRVRR
ncbi:MAG: hypothetical protein AAFP04_12770 [Myxococcota bacterium]